MFQLLIKGPFQTAFSVVTNCPLLVAQLKMKYGIYAFESKKMCASLVIKAIRDGTEYKLLFNGQCLCTISALREIDRIIFENTKYDDQIFALHGAAVEWKGKAYLFLAPTMSGKTTLTTFLVKQGFGYITDDCILLDRNNFRIYPFSTPIQLRSGGVNILKEIFFDSLSDIQHWTNGNLEHYSYLPRNIIKSPVPLSSIFFTSRTDSENRIANMDSIDRMTSLLKSPITKYDICGSYLQFLAKLAKCDCYMLFYHDMNYVAQVIQQE